MMKRALSHPLMHFNKIERGENIIINKNTEETVEERDEEEYDDDDELTDQVQCITLHKKRPQLFNRGEELSVGKHRMWRQKQMSGAARLERQMKARVALEDMIEEQLSRFQSLYNRAMVPTRLKDVAALLMPKWAPPHELAAMAWLGDWRPSSLLDLLSSLTRSSPSLDSIGVEQALPQLTHDIRIEEAVIDEEMAEIQATCILHLSFGSVNKLSTSAALGCIRSEFTKIHGVIVKAQHLRFKVLELIVKKVLSQADAAQFLVAFAGIQDSIHQNARKHRMVKGMGDWSGFMGKIHVVVPMDQQPELLQKLSEGNLRIMYEQFQNLVKMGPIGQVFSMLPGFSAELMPKSREKESQAKIKRYMTMMDSIDD